MRKRYSEVKILEVIKEYQSGVTAIEVCRKHGISKATLYKWNSQYQGMSQSDIANLKILREENRKLKALVADLSLDNVILKESLQKKF
jgi:putative transposase